MAAKPTCRNYNHGKQNPPVAFCPSCGDKFSSHVKAQKTCDAHTHAFDRKNRSLFCSNCGKDLNLAK